MLYFAYGSNMCTGRLRRRVPSAAAPQVAKLSGHTFHFHKRSDDGSGKGNALNTGNPADVVRGVIFRIHPREKHALDDAEGVGHGYVERPVTVTDEAGNQHQTFMYVADEKSIDNSLRPYSWYKRFVVEGARQHRLPADYIARIEAIVSDEDPDRNRDAENRQVMC
jgi:AIG2-like family